MLLLEFSPNRATLGSHSRGIETPGTTDHPESLDMPTWDGLPKISEDDNARISQPQTAVGRLKVSLPSLPDDNLRSIAAAALATNQLMLRGIPNAESSYEISAWNETRAMSRPFMGFLTRILHRVDPTFGINYLSKKLSFDAPEKSITVEKFIKSLWTSWVDHPTFKRPGFKDEYSSQYAHFNTEIKKATFHKNEVKLQAIWQEMQMVCFQPTPSAASEAAQTEAAQTNPTEPIPSGLYLSLMSGFCEARCPNLAVDVWNFMIKHGTKPAITHWSAMMNGCAVARDSYMVEKLWTSMQASDVVVDAQACGIYIKALLWMGNINRALQGINEMGENWVAAVKLGVSDGTIKDISTVDDLPGVPKPNSHILNMIISWNNNLQNPSQELISKVFEWAALYGIKSDTSTFNTMIHGALKKSKWQNLGEGLKIMKEMENRGIQPDKHTFVMLITGIMRSKSVPTEKKSGMINSLLDAMKSNGLEPTAQVFGAIIDGLLVEANLTGAQAVVEYMASQGLAVPLFGYARMLRYHFFGTSAGDHHPEFPTDKKHKPDIAAVEAMLQQMKLKGTEPDIRFYDLIVQHYSRCGMISEAFSFLAKMSSLGMKPTWWTLTRLMEACAHLGLWQRVQMIVQGVREQSGILSQGVRRSSDQVRFWRMCWDLGVRLDANEVEITKREVRDSAGNNVGEESPAGYDSAFNSNKEGVGKQAGEFA